MTAEKSESCTSFRDELSSLIKRHSDALSPADLREVLDEYSVALSGGSLAPVATLQGDGEPYRLRLSYGSAVALERDLSNLLEVQGLLVELDRDLPALTPLTIEVTVEGLDESAELQGRPVSQTDQGTAIHIDKVDEFVRNALRAMPDRARKEIAQRELMSQAPGLSKATSEPIEDAGGAPSPPVRSGLSRDEPFEPEEWHKAGAHSIRDAIVEAALKPGLWLVDVHTAQHRVQILISKGQLRDIRRFPRPRGDRLEVLLHKAGKLEESDLASIEEHVEKYGGGAAEALLERALMSVAQISVAESTRLRFLLERIWKTEPKRVRVAELNMLPRRCMASARHALEFVFHLLREDALAKDDLAARVRERLGDKAFSVSQNAPFDLGLMALSDKQKSTIETLSREQMRLDSALRTSVLSKSDTYALLWALDELDLLDAETVRTWTRKDSRTIERISMMYAKLDRSTHFDILGVHWSAFDDEIEEAFEQLSEQVSEEAIGEEVPDEIKTKANAVREQLEEAYEVIKHTRRRANYRSKVVDDFKLRTSIQMFEKQADTAKLRRDISGAIDFYRRIL
jgi:hypothetical protein